MTEEHERIHRENAIPLVTQVDKCVNTGKKLWLVRDNPEVTSDILSAIARLPSRPNARHISESQLISIYQNLIEVYLAQFCPKVLGDTPIELRNPEHVALARLVFAAAERTVEPELIANLRRVKDAVSKRIVELELNEKAIKYKAAEFVDKKKYALAGIVIDYFIRA